MGQRKQKGGTTKGGESFFFFFGTSQTTRRLPSIKLIEQSEMYYYQTQVTTYLNSRRILHWIAISKYYFNI